MCMLKIFYFTYTQDVVKVKLKFNFLYFKNYKSTRTTINYQLFKGTKYRMMYDLLALLGLLKN